MATPCGSSARSGISSQAFDYRPIGLLLAGLLAVPPAAPAEPAVLESAAFEARIESGKPSTVSARYLVSPGSERTLRFTALHLDGASAANVRAFLDDRELSFHTEGSTGDRLDGRIDLPQAMERVEVRLDYEIDPSYRIEGEPVAITVPLLVPAAPPRRSSPTAFRARVAVPGDKRVRAHFPASFETVEPVDRTHGARAYSFELPVVPAFLRLEVGDELSFWTAERAADSFAMAVLLTLALVGWRQVRERLS